MSKPALIIIGAGLSGLYTAYLLKNDYHITILEARDRLGGRVFSQGEHDMGPSWVWQHHKNILKLSADLGLELFNQYTQGYAMYDEPSGAQRFNPPPQAPSARINGGISTLIHALVEKLDTVDIKLGTIVDAISEGPNSLSVQTKDARYQADFVISTLPPRLARQLKLTPKLARDAIKLLEQTPTWMGHSCKCVIEYEEAFWRDEELSGFGFSHVGPLGEIHDACTSSKAALFGFVQSNTTASKEAIIKQLVRLYGDKALNYTNFYLTDWKKELFSATTEDAKGLQSHPNYGFELTHFNKKMFFSGTESSFSQGGYLEGALEASLTVAKQLKGH